MKRKNAVDVTPIVDFIRSSEEPVGKKRIVEATGYKGKFDYAMKMILAGDYGIVVNNNVNRSLTTYSYVAKKPEAEMKNPEGYPDRTAGKAIANVMRSSNGGRYPMRQSVGEIWTSSNLVDDQEGFLVVSAKEGVCICYNVYPTKKSFMKPDYTMRWTDDIGHTHFISTINPVNLSERKLLKKIGTIGAGEKECLKTSVLNALSIDIPEPQEKVKIVKVNDPITEKRLNEALSQNEKLGKEVERLKKLGDIQPPDNVNLRFDVDALETEAKLKAEIEELKTKLENQAPVTRVEYRTDPKEIEMAELRARCDIFERLIFGDKPILKMERSAS